MPTPLARDIDEARAQRVLQVFKRFADEGVDRAAQLTLAFFASEANDSHESNAHWLADLAQRPQQ